ncbi:MAG: hypothetical protein R6X02_09530 [Enhygromyxa sp.]
MIRGALLLLVSLAALGCDGRATPSGNEAGEVLEPAKREQPHPDPTAQPSVEVDAETGELEPNSPPEAPREVVRRRCKPGYTPCSGGRQCCNDQLEICGDDNRCQPRR